MTWWQAWMAGQVDGSLVAAMLLVVMTAGRHRLSPAFRSALGMLGLVRLAVPPVLIAPWSDAVSEFGALGVARGAVAGVVAGPAGLFSSSSRSRRPHRPGAAGLARRRRPATWITPRHPHPPTSTAGWRGWWVESVGRRPVLRLAADGSGPLATGVLRPLIVLPEGASPGRGGARRGARARLAHHRRHDLAVVALARALAAVAWFNPLAHVLVRAIVSAREDGADDLAVGRRAVARRLRRRCAHGATGQPFGAGDRHRRAPARSPVAPPARDRANRTPRLQWTGIAAVVLVACSPCRCRRRAVAGRRHPHRQGGGGREGWRVLRF